MKAIADLFGGNSDENVQFLSGGQNTSVKVGHIVLKPINNPEEYNWMGSALEDIDFEGINVAKPIRSKTGKFIENGYGATNYFDGSFVPNRLKEKLEISRKFHQAIKYINRPLDFELWDNSWKKAQRIAFKKIPIPSDIPSKATEIIESLLNKLSVPSLSTQFVHCDLAGNMLFSDKQTLLIDLTPGFFPVEYSETLLIVDSIAWHDQPLNSLNLLSYNTDVLRPLVARAIAFRLIVPLLNQERDIGDFEKELDHYSSIARFLNLI
ncbi:hypothetical protein HDE68_004820 [Pedobacter cryoconitis]|uniref:Aminoglycoside phosphotransferase domain-containing protein n=1 Tax=Pedobacter cryoconitis TaxID=188932 RepID=A0A7W8ZS03_9SPHI|nr:hypothetical protein [Pedobacter cryoconitis]MBB5638885.1 hypothetical protein [Pedobacter cryoconitis]